MKFLILLILLPLHAQELPRPDKGKIQPSGKFEPTEQNRPSGLPAKKEIDGKFRIKELDRNRVQVGEVIINRSTRTVTFPADVAVREQVLEYLLVHESGKTHESLLTTKVPAHDIHLGVVLLGANGSSPEINLTWRKNGPDANVSIGDLLEARNGAPTLTKSDWDYIGSSFDSKGFVAQREGSLITLLNDQAALICHRVAAKIGKDDVYAPIVKKLPAKGVPVKVVLTFSK